MLTYFIVLWCSVKIYRHMHNYVGAIPSDSNAHRLSIQLNNLHPDNHPVRAGDLACHHIHAVRIRGLDQVDTGASQRLGFLLVVQPYKRAI